MPKIKNANTQEDFQKGLDIVNGTILNKAKSIAKKFKLKLSQDKKLDTDGGWSDLLKLRFDKENPDFRVGWSCHMSSDFQKQGTACLWDIVTDPDTNTWIQNGKEKVKLTDLENDALHSLELFESNLDKLFKFTPKQMTKKATGLECDWKHKQDKYGTSVWTTDFGTDNVKAKVDSDNSVEVEIDGIFYEKNEFKGTPMETMLALELEYFKKPMIKEKMKAAFK